MKHDVSQKKGFTLLELMIVIVLIGILVTMGTFAFMSSQKKARDARRKQDLSQISKALEMYNNDQNKYPAADASGQISGCGTTYAEVCPWGTSFGNTSSVPNVIYMTKLSKDPMFPSFTYKYVPTTSGYRLYARLENLEDQSIPTTGSKEYPVLCGGTTIYCNYVFISSNVTEPAVR